MFFSNEYTDQIKQIMASELITGRLAYILKLERKYAVLKKKKNNWVCRPFLSLAPLVNRYFWSLAKQKSVLRGFVCSRVFFSLTTQTLNNNYFNESFIFSLLRVHQITNKKPICSIAHTRYHFYILSCMRSSFQLESFKNTFKITVKYNCTSYD